jgi:hypothetical protein
MVQEHAELDIGFEDITARPEAVLQDLAARLELREVRCQSSLNPLPT